MGYPGASYRVRAQRQRTEDDEGCGGYRAGDDAQGGRGDLRGQLHAPAARNVRARIGDGAHGDRPEDICAEPVQSGVGCAESVCYGRRGVPVNGVRESDADHDGDDGTGLRAHSGSGEAEGDLIRRGTGTAPESLPVRSGGRWSGRPSILVDA